MLKILSALSLLLLISLQLYAQYQAPPVWTFGKNAGIDFNNGSATPIKTGIETHGSVSATQCDKAGNILFYSNGISVWDKNGNEMPNAGNPIWNTSNAFGWEVTSAIVPHSSDTNLYYVFQTFPSKGEAPWGPYYNAQLTYSLVDMRLNGGMGDIVVGQEHILLDNKAAHFMTVVPGNNCDYWVLVQPYSSGLNFHAYHITPTGIDTNAVVSTTNGTPTLFPPAQNATMQGCRAGNIIYSYTRNKIITTYESADICSYDFDPSTGKVSNPVTLAWAYPRGENYSSHTTPAICLSPDENLLYVSGYSNTMQIFQVRQFPIISGGSGMSLGVPVVIYNATSWQYLSIQQPNIGYGWKQSAMQLGADNKIYHTFTLGQSFLARINNPNISGIGCNFVPDAIILAPNTWTTSAMPSPMFSRRSPTRIAQSDTSMLYCFQQSVTLNAPAGFANYEWQNGQSGNTFDVTTSGTYVVTSTQPDCRYREDTFKVRLVDFKLSLGDDNVSCMPEILHAGTGQPTSYLWFDGSTEETYHADTAGKYWVTATSPEGCVVSDTIQITKEVLDISLPGDTTLCAGETMALQINNSDVNYVWQDGSTENQLNVTGAGTYHVTATKGFCKESDTMLINEMFCDNCLLGVPNAFTPNQDGKNDIFRPVINVLCPVRNYQLYVFNRFGQKVYGSGNFLQGWDGTFNGQLADLGTYFYHLKFDGPGNKAYFYKGDVILIR